MKVLVVNYRYFVSGGPERYLFNIISVFQENNHSIIPFSIKNNKNMQSHFESDFMDSIHNDAVYYEQFRLWNFRSSIKALFRMVYSFEARKKIGNLIRKEQPDLVYILHFQNKISCSILDEISRFKIPIVHRVSDFGLICANGLFFRPVDNTVCEKCLHGSNFNAISHKCIKDSYALSAIKVLSLFIQRLRNINSQIDAFVVPSVFTLNKLAEAGIERNKLNHIPTFFKFSESKNDLSLKYQSFALYVGRIEPEKGIKTMIDAFVEINKPLKIIGFSGSGYEKDMKEYLGNKNHQIEFLGKMDFSDVKTYLSSCLFTIAPSEWYDNLPNSVLESFAYKKAVVASDIGSLKELITHNETGLLYEKGNSKSLIKAAEKMFSDVAFSKSLGQKAYVQINTLYSEKEHYSKLITLFESLIKNNTKISF